MKLPILAYGHSILKQKCEMVTENFQGLDQLIIDMWETMFNASGCGLAAPQIGFPIQLFIVDSKSTFDNLEGTDEQQCYFDTDKGIKETFINATIIDYSQDTWEEEEGCLSIPGLTQKVKRSWGITIEYYNQDFQKQTKTYTGTTARMIQHEYDHTQGKLYLDYLKPLTKKLMESKLKRIMKGQFLQRYPMKFI